MISEHLTSWLGFPVHPLDFEALEQNVPDLSRTVCRLHIGWESAGSFTELFERFLRLPGVERTPAIVIGAFTGDDPSSESDEAVQLLVNAHARLPALRGIFLGDIISEENEISWINQSDVSPLFLAFPKLEHFTVRGANSLVLGKISHTALKSFVIQSGGLPRSVLADLARCNFPNLEHLELWLGEDNYGWDGTVADLTPLLDPRRFPNLRQLGLCNSEIQDEVVTQALMSDIVPQLDALNFSMGALSDEGGNALLAHPELKRLKSLDLHHHYLSPEVEEQIRKIFPQADLSERNEPDGDGDDAHRSIAVSE